MKNKSTIVFALIFLIGIVLISSFVLAVAPSVSNLIINSSSGTNTTDENLSIIFSASDGDSDPVYNITDWRVDGASIAVLNMPFDTSYSSTTFQGLRDYSTYGNNGTLGDGTSGYVPTWTNAAGCKVGGCYTFDGNDDRIVVEDSDSLTLSEGFSVSFWMYPTPDLGYETVFVKEVENPHTSENIMFVSDIYNSNRWTFRVNGTSVLTLEDFRSIWSHIILTFNSTTGVCNIYQDGVLVNTTSSCTYTLPDTSGEFVIGDVISGSGSTEFEGKIDEFLVFDRELSQGQVETIYNYTNNGKSIQAIFSNETSNGDVWSVAVTPTDLTEEGSTVLSENLEIGTQFVGDCGTLSSPGTYKLTTNASSTDTCFTISSDNVTLDCQGNYVNYASSSTGYGVVNNGNDNLLIQNCNFNLSSLTVTNSIAVYSYGNVVNTNVKDSNVTIFTEHASTTNNFGIYYYQSLNSLIENVNVSSTSNGYFGYGDYGLYLRDSDNSRVINNEVYTRCYSCYALHLYSSDNITVYNNKFDTDFGRSFGIGNYYSDNCNISNNNVSTTDDDAGGDASFGIFLANSADNNILRNNRVTSLLAPSYVAYSGLGNDVDTSNYAEDYPVLFNDSLSDYVFENLNLSNYGQVLCANCNNVTYRNVTIRNDGLLQGSSTNGFVFDSDIVANTSHGLYFYSSSGYLVNNTNISTLSNDVNPLKLRVGSNNNNFTNNYISEDKNDYAIYLQDSDYLLFENNFIDSGGSNYATLFYGGTDYENFTNNYYNCPNFCLILDSSSYTESYFVNNSFNNGGYPYVVVVYRGNNNYVFVDNDFGGDSFYMNTAASNHTFNITNTSTLGGLYWNQETLNRYYLHDYVDVNATDGVNAVSGANVYAYDNNSVLRDSGTTSASGIERLTVLRDYENYTNSISYNNYTINGTKGMFYDEKSVNVTGYSVVNLTLGNVAPTNPLVEILSSLGTNTSAENLTVIISGSTDVNDDTIYNVTDWRINGTSIAVLNMPFDLNISSVDTNAVRDYSTYGNDGTITFVDNSPVWTNSCKVGGCYSFNRTGYVDLGSDLTFVNFTFSFWVYPHYVGGSKNIVLSKYSGYSNVYLTGDPAYVRTESFTNGQDWGFTSAVVPYDQWTHIAVVRQGDEVSVYLNGSFVENNTIAGADVTQIRYVSQNIASAFNGSIDEVKIFNRTLSPEQVQAIYLNESNGIASSLISSSETIVDENWSVAVTANDLINESETIISENLTILISGTCTYSGSGNWEVDCSDGCNITSEVNVGGNNISITGIGTFTTTANITNYDVLRIEGQDSANICTVRCQGGCFV
ncbi:MAG: right-handed parallel beta-helix repeat-containing protein [Nanoarchaeota archaeon]|nr:right-handed parallel beta-helix repeat-containing protein [Nanoarchaeota archaeon]